MATATQERGAARGAEPGAEQVLAVVREMAVAARPEEEPPKVRLDSSLEADLGLDSVARAELVGRLERALEVKLPERLLADAESPRDLLRAVAAAEPAGARPAAGAPAAEELVPEDEVVAAPEDAGTLLEVLDWHAEEHPERRHVLFLEDPDRPEEASEELTYGDLRDRARAAAARLRDLGVEAGDTVGLMLPSGLAYFAAFAGAQLAGAVPVPLYPPARRSQLEDHLRRQAGILENARVKVLVAFPEVGNLTRLLRGLAPHLETVVTAEELEGEAGEGPFPPVGERDTAFLQYTSGSTGAPKGVVLTHRNLLANLRSMGEVVDLGSDDVVVSWLPLYHDMGLIGAWMGSLYYGMPLVLMSPLSFLARPVRWLRAVQRYRGTISAAPDFGYQLCLAKIGDDELEGLDLSSWRLALNGAEPVRPATVEEFPARFAHYGLAADAMMPVYGLAESSLAVAFTPPERPPRIDAVGREPFQRDGRADPAADDEADPLRFVSSGLPLPGHEVRIVDQGGEELPERREGRLEFRGPSATSGYFRNPEATETLFDGEWLDSGDLGYLADGEVFVTGRTKDVIIRAGRNIYPEEVEEAVGRLDGVRKGCVAVFAGGRPGSGEEEALVVLAETRRDDEASRRQLERAIEEVTLDLTGTAPDDVVLVPPRTVPKTSSGKLRRSASRELYERGELEKGRRSVWWQVARLALAGVWARLALRVRAAGPVLYAAWFWTAFLLLAPGVWLWVAILPRRSWRRRLVRSAARFAARLTSTPLRVEGEPEQLEGGRRVIAANHASYLDGFVLAAVLPPDAAYVVKGELAGPLVSRVFLRRLGALFVERFDPEKGAEDIGRAVRLLQEGGDSLVIFPEGTFQPPPGLLPFHSGGFHVAVEAGAPVVPVALRGTRAKLRGSSWFPRPGGVRVTVRPSIEPEGTGWQATAELRQKVRAEILRHSGEPDLAR
jgi:1-acyl-sn-glycerol-3-phosphate acyltransferase